MWKGSDWNGQSVMSWKNYKYVCRCTEKTQCNPCAKRKYRLAHKDVLTPKIRQEHRYRKYGLTTEMFDILWRKQGGCCAICAKPLVDEGHDGLHVDHHHETQAVRGLLCGHCNRGLGQFMDSAELLFKASEYLKGNG